MKWDIKRGDIILCDLGINEGHIQNGIRPCVVVSNDVGNTFSNIYIVIPLTTKFKGKQSTHAYINTDKYSCALCEQVTTISDQQVLRKTSFINDDNMKIIEHALKKALDLKENRNEENYNG